MDDNRLERYTWSVRDLVLPDIEGNLSKEFEFYEPSIFIDSQLSAFVWNPYTRSYQTVAGKVVDTSKVRDLVADIRAATSENLRNLALRVQSGKETNLAQFAIEFKDELKTLYIATHVLARGGIDQMDQSDWGALGSALKDQYYYVG